MVKEYNFIFLTIFSLFPISELLASPQERQEPLSEKDDMQLLESPQIIRPVREDEQRLKELLYKTAFLKNDDFVWLQVDDGGIKLWFLNKENTLRASAPVYFPGAFKYFVPYGNRVPEKIDPKILWKWKGIEFRSIQLDNELSLAIKALYKTLHKYYLQIPPSRFRPTWSLCAACNPQYDKEISGQDVLVASGSLHKGMYGFCTGNSTMTVIQAWQCLCLLLHDLASFGILEQDEQLWLSMETNRLRKLIEQRGKNQKSEKLEGMEEGKPFKMESLTLPASLDNQDIWSMLFPDDGDNSGMITVNKRSAKNQCDHITLDAQGISIKGAYIRYAATNWDMFQGRGQIATSAPHYAYAFLCNILPEIKWKKAVTDYNMLRKKRGLKEMDDKAVASMVFRLGYISRFQMAWPEKKMKRLAEITASSRRDAFHAGENRELSSRRWKKGNGEFIRLSSSSPWFAFNEAPSDLQKVFYYFMDLGRNRGVAERIQDEKTEEIRSLLEK